MDGIKLIKAERQRQIEVEKFDASNDAKYVKMELPRAATAYTLSACAISEEEKRTVHTWLAQLWPWDISLFKPKTPLHDLVKAGALIAAEIDRRLAAGEKP